MFRTCSETGTAAGLLNGLSEIFQRRGRAAALPWGLTPGRPPRSAEPGSPPAPSREVSPKASPPSPPRPPPKLVFPPAILRECEAAASARDDPPATTTAAAREDGSDGDDATGREEGGGAAATAGVEEEEGRGVRPNPGVALWWSPAARRSSALSLASGLRSRSIRSSCACSKLRSSRRTVEDCSLPPSTGVDIGWGRSLPGWGSIARA